jgi:hypothetical protein
MEAGLIAPGQQVRAVLQRLIGHQRHGLGQADGAGEADVRAGRGLDLLVGREAQWVSRRFWRAK